MQIKITAAEVTLTEDSWESLVDTAGYGIGYWAVAPCIVDDEAQTYTVRFYGTADDPQDGGDDDEISEVTLTKSDLEQAIARTISEYPWRAENFTDEGYDAEDADIVIQLAVFGKHIFG